MNEYISKIINHSMRVPVLVGVVSFIGGGAVGYLLGRRQYTPFDIPSSQMYFDFVDEDVEIRVKPKSLVVDASDYEAITDKGESVVPGVIRGNDANLEIIDEPVDEAHLVTKNVFEDIKWDLEEERKTRGPAEPYILHKDEFYADERDYSQHTLSYYSGDDIMVDEEEKPVYNHAQITGPLKFGHGSGDKKVFYVRNDKRKAEYEIILIDALYSEEVLGLEIEDNARVNDLKHSKLGKFRDD